MSIQEKIKQLEKELAKINWTKEQAQADELKKQLTELEAVISSKLVMVNIIQTTIGKLREVEEILST